MTTRRQRMSMSIKRISGRRKKRLGKGGQRIVRTPCRSVGAKSAFFVRAVVFFAAVLTGSGKEQSERQAGLGADREQELSRLPSPFTAEDAYRVDLNFDGWDDLCILERSTDGINIPCRCMLWNPRKNKFEYSVTLSNVETDPEHQWIESRVAGAYGEAVITFWRYDGQNQLHMVRYVEENPSGEFTHLDLTYIEDGGPYTLMAMIDEEGFDLTMVEMAKQALSELYQWTGEKVETACFQVSDVGGVVFSQTPEDMAHSRIFFSRYFGADTQYNLSGYEKSISSIGISLGRRFWFSPVFWRYCPENADAMTDEEVIVWYFERLPTSDHGRVKSIEERFEGMWTIRSESGLWFEVFYDKELREVCDVTGPYPERPEH